MSVPSSITELIHESRVLERNGNVATALERAQEAVALAQTCGDSGALVTALLQVGSVRYRLGQFDPARELAQQALDLAKPGSPAFAYALIGLGVYALETGSHAEAEQFLHRAADIGRESGDIQLRFKALVDLAAVYIPCGKFDLALAADVEAHHLATEHNLQEQVYLPLLHMAQLYWLMGQRAQLAATLEELDKTCSPGSIPEGYRSLLCACVAQDEGEMETAATLLTHVRSIAETIGDPGLNCLLRIGLSRQHRTLGDAAKAYEWATDAVALADRMDSRRMWGRAMIERARAEWQGGHRANAEADLRAAIKDLSNRRMAFDLTRAYLFLAALLLEQLRPEADAAWHAAARSILEGNYTFLLEQERALAFPLIAAYWIHSDPEMASLANALIAHLERVPPPSLQILTLGQFRVRQMNRTIPDSAWRRRRAGELFRLLLITPTHSLSREEIVEALWQSKSSASPDLLHQATSALRRALEPELPDKFPSRYLVIEEGRVTLYLPPGSFLDFESFEQHVKNEEWGAAISVYQGELFPGDRYADWTTIPRERLQRMYLRALLVVAHRRSQAGQHRESLDLCYRILEIEPWQEDAVLLGMRACLAFNDRAGALRLYRELEHALREELDTSPQPQLRELYKSLRPERLI